MVRLFFAGDFCSTPSTSEIHVTDELKNLIQSCDLKVVNFEIPLKPADMAVKPGWYFYQNDDSPDFLKNLGFNLFSFANNHAFDYGVEGFNKTRDALGDASFGSGTYDEAYKPKIVEINGIKIGFLAVCYAARFGVFDNLSEHCGLGCAWINDLKVNHVILEAKKKVDYLIVLPHDGIEYIDIPVPETIARYRDFIDYGADAVIGTHPHCPQGWEEYKGKPIFYSLGNFLFNSKEGYQYRVTNRPHWYEGLCVILTINDGMMCYDAINTLNEGNMLLSVDHDPKRVEQNEALCEYLKDSVKYKAKLIQECERLTTQQEMLIIDNTFHRDTIVSSFKQMVKMALDIVLHRQLPNDNSLLLLLKNDTRRNVLLHGIADRR